MENANLRMMNMEQNETEQQNSTVNSRDMNADDAQNSPGDVLNPSRTEHPQSASQAGADGAAITSTAGETAEPATTGNIESVEGMELRPVLEAILFSTDVPISAGKLAQTVGLDSTKPVKAAINELNEIYGQRHAAYRLEERAGGYQLLTLPQYAQYIQRLTKARDEGRLTPAALETLAIIAYRQPILRVDVESIRGVACGEVIRTLMEYNLVKIVGRAEEIGRPMLYGTTRHFLEVFGLSSLKDLPNADQLKEPKVTGNP